MGDIYEDFYDTYGYVPDGWGWAEEDADWEGDE